MEDLSDDIYTEFKNYDAEIYQQAIKRFGLRRYAAHLDLFTNLNRTEEEEKKHREDWSNFHAYLQEIKANDAEYERLYILNEEYMRRNGRLYLAAFRRQFFGSREELEADAFKQAKMRFGFEAYERLMVLEQQKRKTEEENKQCSEGLRRFRALRQKLSDSVTERLRQREERMQEKQQAKIIADKQKLEEKLNKASIFKKELNATNNIPLRHNE